MASYADNVPAGNIEGEVRERGLEGGPSTGVERRRPPSGRAGWAGAEVGSRRGLFKVDRAERKRAGMFICVELFFRLMQMACAAIAIAAIVTAGQAGLEFNHYQAFCYLLAAATAALAWATGGFLIDLGKVLPDWAALHMGFLLDLLMTILAFSAGAAALGLIRFFDQGLPGTGSLLLRGPCQATGFGHWCSRVKTAASFMIILGTLYIFSNIWTAMKSIISRYEVLA